ncbi:MAG: FAD-dependent thymidylate synthase [Candidatus Magasanikbacteria bacterium]
MENLKHVEKALSSGGFVLVLDTGAVIDAQAEAMLQALHSRSTGGIKSHLEILKKKGAENFMEKFYVGYGHKSIGDCGSATIFVEGVSMLAAKAIQDWRLYSGQEASTRYVDFSKQAFINPLQTEEGNTILENWRTFYLNAQKPIQEHLKKQNPRQEGEDEKMYDKAIIARAFDITRSFLPAGASTNLAWRMNLRQFADKLMLLRHHPLEEVREIAEKTEEALQTMYPQSFSHLRFEHTEKYNASIMEKHYYVHEKAEKFSVLFDGVNRQVLEETRQYLEERPIKTELPPTLAETGVLTYEFLLDFGSFRDIQRHRAVVQRMPLLTRTHGFHDWYLNSLPEDLRAEALEFLDKQKARIDALETSEEVKQYYTAMGYRVPCRVTGDIKALVYLAELRSSRFVHPTLVEQAINIIHDLKNRFSEYGLVIHQDDEPNRFDIRRGEQDIVLK